LSFSKNLAAMTGHLSAQEQFFRGAEDPRAIAIAVGAKSSSRQMQTAVRQGGIRSRRRSHVKFGGPHDGRGKRKNVLILRRFLHCQQFLCSRPVDMLMRIIFGRRACRPLDTTAVPVLRLTVQFRYNFCGKFRSCSSQFRLARSTPIVAVSPLIPI
jgi:hypothetical protein